MHKMYPAGDTLHVSFERTQAVSLKSRPFTHLPLLRPYLFTSAGVDEFPSAVTMET